MTDITVADLREWCSIDVDDLEGHADAKVPFRLCDGSEEMGRLMATDLIDEVERNNRAGTDTRAILPCGPMAWYRPFASMVIDRQTSLKRLTVFHMDECLDWQAQPLPASHPYNFKSTMEREFYASIPTELGVPISQRIWPTLATMSEIADEIASAPISITLGGIGQDGHLAYNQARRHPFSRINLDDLRNSTVRVQENNWDTIVAIAHRTFGGAHQFVPPMSITLGVKECLSAERIRLYTDTGAWKQTALRVILFGPLTVEYPATLLQEHPDALITATRETATHPVAEHPEWDLGTGTGQVRRGDRVGPRSVHRAVHPVAPDSGGVG